MSKIYRTLSLLSILAFLAIELARSAFAAPTLKDIQRRMLDYVLKSKTTSTEKDILESWTPSPAFAGGTLFYVNNILSSTENRHILTSREVEEERLADKTVKANLFEVSLAAFDLHFSPDGHYLLMSLAGSAWPFEQDAGFSLILFDAKASRLENGPVDDLRYPIIKWSPDSRYIAYIAGGDYKGDPYLSKSAKRSETYVKPQLPQLKVYDVHTRRSRLILQDTTAPEFAWTPENTLLLARQKRIRSQPDKAHANEPYEHHAIYEAQISGGQPRLLIDNGSGDMSASPDGEWIVFDSDWATHTAVPAGGIEDLETAPSKATEAEKAAKPTLPSKAEVTVTKAGYYLYNRREKKLYPSEFKSYRSPVWTPDSKRLVLLSQGYDMEKGRGGGLLYVYDLASKVQKVYSLGTVQDFKPVNVDQFEFLDISLDGRFAYVARKNTTGIGDDGLYAQDLEVIAADLHDGTVSTLCKLKNPKGVDWFAGRALP